MFRRQTLRASRAVYLASSSAIGTVVAGTSETGDQSAPADITLDAPPPEGAIDDVEPHPVPMAIESEPPKTLLPNLPEKLSIYPSPMQPLVLVDTPSPLELHIGQARRQVCGYYSGARTHVQGVIDRWIRMETAVESRLKSFRDPMEPLNPGLLYVGIATLTASVVVRSRSLPVRFVVPPLSCIGACAYFLPRTTGRVGGWAEELEGRYAPRVGEIRRTSVAHTGMALGMLGEKYREGREGLGRGARRVVEGIESGTGLKLGEVLGWTRSGSDKKSGSDENKN